MADILVVDDDQSIATAFQHFLSYEGHECRIASGADEGARMIEARRPDVVMMDIRMPGTDGLTALQDFRARFPGLYVVMMTAYGTSQTSINAIRSGAFDYLTKPLDLDDLREVLTKALAAQAVERSAGHASAAEGPPLPATLVGETPAMLEVYKMIGRLATNSVPALIMGERGTGKGLVVATIHDNSDRRQKTLVPIDCAHVTEQELMALLFTGDGGTVELGNIHLLSPALQAVVVHALVEVRTRGAAARLTSRVVATADHDPADDVASGTVARELYDELAVITLRLPPLRERRDDIPLLVRHFVQRFNAELNREIRGVDDAVGRMLQVHAWPGNVGEMERVMKRGCIVARSDVITPDDIGESLTDSRFPGRRDVESALDRSVRAAFHDRLVQSAGGSVFHTIVDAVESVLVQEALTITNGNQVKAADILGVNRATLRKKMSTAD